MSDRVQESVSKPQFSLGGLFLLVTVITILLGYDRTLLSAMFGGMSLISATVVSFAAAIVTAGLYRSLRTIVVIPLCGTAFGGVLGAAWEFATRAASDRVPINLASEQALQMHISATLAGMLGGCVLGMGIAFQLKRYYGLPGDTSILDC